MRLSLALMLLFVSVTGCPDQHEQRAGRLPACSKFGDRCEFAPGKLGSCVVRDGCTGSGTECFTCQSQH